MKSRMTVLSLLPTFCSALVLALFAFHCTPTGQTSQNFTCEKERDGWTQCKDGRIQECHAGATSHFDWGQDCQAQSLVCEKAGEKKAHCVDKAKTCKDGESRCESNTAYTCVGGFFAVEPCGTAKECHKSDTEAAHCEARSGAEECSGHGHLHEGSCECETGYKLDPQDKTKCIKE